MDYNVLKEQLLSSVDEIVKTIANDKTIEIRKGKDDSIQLFEIKKKVIKK